MPRTKPEPVQAPEDEGFVSPTREEPEPMTDKEVYDEALRVFGDDLVDPDAVQAEIDAMDKDIEGVVDDIVERYGGALNALASGLHAKLADLRANFGFIGKTGTNKGVGGGYGFVEAHEVARRFVEMASERSLTMIPVAMHLEEPRPSASGKQIVDTLSVTWRVTDAESSEYIDVPSYGQGADQADKSLPKAQTNAMKYAILLLLQAAGDDPENDPRTDQIENTQEMPGINITGSNISGVQQGGRQTKATGPQMDAIKTQARRLDLEPESFAVLIGSILGGKAPEIDAKEATIDQQRAILAFCGELDFAEAGELIRGLEATPSVDELIASTEGPEDVGAK